MIFYSNFSRLFSIVLRALGAAATAITSFVMLNRFGPTINGEFQTGLAITLLFSSLYKFGQDNFLFKKFVEQKLNVKSYYSDLLNTSLLINLSFSSLFCLIFWILGFIFLDIYSYIYIFVIVAILLSVLSIVTEALRGSGNIIAWAFLQNFMPAVSIFIIILFIPLNYADTTIKISYWVLLTYTITSFLSLQYFYKLFSIKREFNFFKKYRKKIRRNIYGSRTFWFYAILSSASASLDIIILSAIAPAEIIGVFNPIIRVGSSIAVIVNLVMSIYVTDITSSFYKNGISNFKKIIARTTIMSISISLFLFSILLIFENQIFEYAGKEFKFYYLEYYIYLSIQIIQSVFLMPMIVAPFIGLEKQMMHMQWVNIILKLVFITIGYTYFGLLGTFLAIGIVTISTTGYITFAFVKKCRSRIDK